MLELLRNNTISTKLCWMLSTGLSDLSSRDILRNQTTMSACFSRCSVCSCYFYVHCSWISERRFILLQVVILWGLSFGLVKGWHCLFKPHSAALWDVAISWHQRKWDAANVNILDLKIKVVWMVGLKCTRPWTIQFRSWVEICFLKFTDLLTDFSCNATQSLV